MPKNRQETETVYALHLIIIIRKGRRIYLSNCPRRWNRLFFFLFLPDMRTELKSQLTKGGNNVHVIYNHRSPITVIRTRHFLREREWERWPVTVTITLSLAILFHSRLRIPVSYIKLPRFCCLPVEETEESVNESRHMTNGISSQPAKMNQFAKQHSGPFFLSSYRSDFGRIKQLFSAFYTNLV